MEKLLKLAPIPSIYFQKSTRTALEIRSPTIINKFAKEPLPEEVYELVEFKEGVVIFASVLPFLPKLRLQNQAHINIY